MRKGRVNKERGKRKRGKEEERDGINISIEKLAMLSY